MSKKIAAFVGVILLSGIFAFNNAYAECVQSSKTYTSCNDGYTLFSGDCIAVGGGDIVACEGSKLCVNNQACINSGYASCGSDGCCTGTCSSSTYCTSKSGCVAAGYGACTNNCCTGTCSSSTYCTSNANCVASGYPTCSDGCCTGSCQWGVCTSNSDCASGTCSNNCCTRPTVQTCSGSQSCSNKQSCIEAGYGSCGSDNCCTGTCSSAKYCTTDNQCRGMTNSSGGRYNSCSSNCCTGTLSCSYGICDSNSDCASGTCTDHCCTNPDTGGGSGSGSGSGSSCSNGSCSTASDCPTVSGKTKSCALGCCYYYVQSTCSTATCSTDIQCTRLGYGSCMGGCCVGETENWVCSTTSCTSDADCSGMLIDSYAFGMCIGGKCYQTNNRLSRGFVSLQQCQQYGNCGTDEGCRSYSEGGSSSGRSYACGPNCAIGKYWQTSVCACDTCSAYVTEAFTDAALTTPATATTTAAGKETITSCYIPSGTYHDAKGTFTYSSDCYYTE